MNDEQKRTVEQAVEDAKTYKTASMLATGWELLCDWVLDPSKGCFVASFRKGVGDGGGGWTSRSVTISPDEIRDLADKFNGRGNRSDRRKREAMARKRRPRRWS